MPEYRYSAVDQAGRPRRGRLDAGSEADLEQCLKHLGLDLVACRAAGRRWRLPRANRVAAQDLVVFCFQMEQLLRAGVTLPAALADVREGMSDLLLRTAAGSLVTELEGGKLLSQAMAMHPEAFGQVFVSLICAGERTGRMAEVFANLAATLAWQQQLLAQARRLLGYPLLVLAVVLGATGFLMAYLVPQMAAFLQNTGQPLPLQTRALIALSGCIGRWWWLILSLPALAAVMAACAASMSPAARYRLDLVKLRLPVTGAILQKIILARFSRYLALMYQAGIPLLDAIRACQDIVGNRAVADGLGRAWQQINAGGSMSESFRSLGLFPPLVVRMMRVGETTGSLPAALLNVSQFYERDVRDALDGLLKMLEPAMTVILGGMLGLIMFSVLSPIYDVFGKFKF